MAAPARIALGAVGWAGHVFPLLSLGRELARRGHTVMLESFERWREVAAENGIELSPAPESVAFPSSSRSDPDQPTMAEAAHASLRAISEFGADVVVCDLFSIVPALAADLGGIPRASVIPHPYPHPPRGWPPFNSGFRPPRSPIGAAGWRLSDAFDAGARRAALGVLNAERAGLGLEPITSASGMTSERLAIVATFPQLEYERGWPGHVHVTGPLPFSLPEPEIELPPGDAPLVLVAASTAQDPRRSLVETALEALAAEPVRLVATLNERGMQWPGPVPANAAVVDWASYAQVMPEAALMIGHGGHGTLARALAEGVPAIVCPEAGDQAENGARLAWSGAGVMVPNRLVSPRTLASAARCVLSDGSYRARAGEIAAWHRRKPGPARAADLLERLILDEMAASRA